MSYYVYRAAAPLGKEPVGTDGRTIWHDLKTDAGAVRRAERYFKSGPLRIYQFTNFYNNDTFRPIFARD